MVQYVCIRTRCMMKPGGVAAKAAVLRPDEISKTWYVKQKHNLNLFKLMASFHQTGLRLKQVNTV